MRTYQCCFLDEHERVEVAECIEAEAASDAIDRALAMLFARPHHRAVEVWQGTRLLYLSDRPKPAVPTP